MFNVYIVNEAIRCFLLQCEEIDTKHKCCFEVLFQPKEFEYFSLKNYFLVRIRSWNLFESHTIFLSRYKIVVNAQSSFQRESRVANQNDMSITGNSPIEIRYESKIQWKMIRSSLTWSCDLIPCISSLLFPHIIVVACACETIDIDHDDR